MHHINFPLIGNSAVMALVILVHVFMAFIAVGGLVLAVASEWYGHASGSVHAERFARGYVKFLSDLMKIGGVLGATFVALLIGLFPEFAEQLYHIMFWPLTVEAGFFLLLAISSVTYRATWDKTGSKPAHIAIGLTAAGAGVAAAVIINAAWAFMLTPGDYFSTGSLRSAVFNPAMEPSTFHVLIACVANAAGAAFLYAMRKGAKEAGDGYYAWLRKYAGTIFAGVILLQPLSGLSFIFKLKAVSAPVYGNVLGGAATPFFWKMVTLAAVAVLSSLGYLLSGRRHPRVLLIGVLAAMTAFFFGAYTRERARKPFLIYGYMYMNGSVTVPKAPAAQQAPAAQEKKAPAPKPATGAPKSGAGKPAAAKPAAVPAADVKALLDKHNCLVCHSYKGAGGTFGPDLTDNLGHHTRDGLKHLLLNPPESMAPFEGTEAELQEFVNAAVP